MPLLECKGFIKTDELNIKFSLDQSMLPLLCSLIYYDTGKSSDTPEKLLYSDHFPTEMFYPCLTYLNLSEVFAVLNYKLIGLCKSFNISYTYI